jgi:hypothetical protein
MIPNLKPLTFIVDQMTDKQVPRRIPPPWSVDELEACFIVHDHNGQKLAYVYCDDEPGRRAATKLLTRDEAQRIAPSSPPFTVRPGTSATAGARL